MAGQVALTRRGRERTDFQSDTGSLYACLFPVPWGQLLLLRCFPAALKTANPEYTGATQRIRTTGFCAPTSPHQGLWLEALTGESVLLTGGLVPRWRPGPSIAPVRPGSPQVQAQVSPLSLEAQPALRLKYDPVWLTWVFEYFTWEKMFLPAFLEEGQPV